MLFVTIILLFICLLVFWEQFVPQFKPRDVYGIKPKLDKFGLITQVFFNKEGNWQLQLPIDRSGMMPQIHHLEKGSVVF